MKIKHSDIKTVVHLIDILISLNALCCIYISNDIFFNVKSIDYDTTFDFITIIDFDNRQHFYDSTEFRNVIIKLNDGRCL